MKRILESLLAFTPPAVAAFSASAFFMFVRNVLGEGLHTVLLALLITGAL